MAYFQEWLSKTFKPCCLVLCSDKAKEIFAENNLTPAEFLRPLGDFKGKKLQIQFNEKDKEPISLNDLVLDFYDAEQFNQISQDQVINYIEEMFSQNEPSWNLNSPLVTKNSLESVKNNIVPGQYCTPWFKEFEKTILECLNFDEYDLYQQPIISIYITYIGESISVINDVLAKKSPRLITTKRYDNAFENIIITLNDCKNRILKKEELEKSKSRFAIFKNYHIIHLDINCPPFADKEDRGQKIISENYKNYIHKIDIYNPSNEKYKNYKDKQYGKYINDEQYKKYRDEFFHYFSDVFLQKLVEKIIGSFNEKIKESTKFTSLFKKIPKKVYDHTNIYRFSELERTYYNLGLIYFYFHNYDSANENLKLVRNSLKDKSNKHKDRVKEIKGMCKFLQKKVTKKEFNYLEELKLGGNPHQLIRLELIIIKMLESKLVGNRGDMSEIYKMINYFLKFNNNKYPTEKREIIIEYFNALLEEKLAIYNLTENNFRKYVFYMSISGKTFLGLDKKNYALYCLSKFLYFIDNPSPSFQKLRMHFNTQLGEICNSLKYKEGSFKFYKNSFEFISLNPEISQNTQHKFLQYYVSMYTQNKENKLNSNIDLTDLNIPQVDNASLFILEKDDYDIKQSSEKIENSKEKNWLVFNKYAESLTTDVYASLDEIDVNHIKLIHELTNETDKKITNVHTDRYFQGNINQKLFVNCTIRNPLGIKIDITSLKLYCSFIPKKGISKNLNPENSVNKGNETKEAINKEKETSSNNNLEQQEEVKDNEKINVLNEENKLDNNNEIKEINNENKENKVEDKSKEDNNILKNEKDENLILEKIDKNNNNNKEEENIEEKKVGEEKKEDYKIKEKEEEKKDKKEELKEVNEVKEEVKEDIKEVKEELKDVKEEIKEELKELKEEIKEEVKELNEIKEEVNEVKEELNDEKKEIKEDKKEEVKQEKEAKEERDNDNKKLNEIQEKLENENGIINKDKELNEISIEDKNNLGNKIHEIELESKDKESDLKEKEELKEVIINNEENNKPAIKENEEINMIDNNEDKNKEEIKKENQELEQKENKEESKEEIKEELKNEIKKDNLNSENIDKVNDNKNEEEEEFFDDFEIITKNDILEKSEEIIKEKPKDEKCQENINNEGNETKQNDEIKNEIKNEEIINEIKNEQQKDEVINEEKKEEEKDEIKKEEQKDEEKNEIKKEEQKDEIKNEIKEENKIKEKNSNESNENQNINDNNIEQIKEVSNISEIKEQTPKDNNSKDEINQQNSNLIRDNDYKDSNIISRTSLESNFKIDSLTESNRNDNNNNESSTTPYTPSGDQTSNLNNNEIILPDNQNIQNILSFSVSEKTLLPGENVEFELNVSSSQEGKIIVKGLEFSFFSQCHIVHLFSKKITPSLYYYRNRKKKFFTMGGASHISSSSSSDYESRNSSELMAKNLLINNIIIPRKNKIEYIVVDYTNDLYVSFPLGTKINAFLYEMLFFPILIKNNSPKYRVRRYTIFIEESDKTKIKSFINYITRDNKIKPRGSQDLIFIPLVPMTTGKMYLKILIKFISDIRQSPIQVKRFLIKLKVKDSISFESKEYCSNLKEDKDGKTYNKIAFNIKTNLRIRNEKEIKDLKIKEPIFSKDLTLINQKNYLINSNEVHKKYVFDKENNFSKNQVNINNNENKYVLSIIQKIIKTYLGKISENQNDNNEHDINYIINKFNKILNNPNSNAIFFPWEATHITKEGNNNDSSTPKEKETTVYGLYPYKLKMKNSETSKTFLSFLFNKFTNLQITTKKLDKEKTLIKMILKLDKIGLASMGDKFEKYEIFASGSQKSIIWLGPKYYSVKNNLEENVFTCRFNYITTLKGNIEVNRISVFVHKKPERKKDECPVIKINHITKPLSIYLD